MQLYKAFHFTFSTDFIVSILKSSIMHKFSEYLGFAPCYAKQRAETGRCISNFSASVEKMTAVTYDDDYMLSDAATDFTEFYYPDAGPTDIMCK